MGDKLRGKVDQATGKVKEGVGRAGDDEQLAEEGRREQAKGDLREAAGKVKDAARDAAAGRGARSGRGAVPRDRARPGRHDSPCERRADSLALIPPSSYGRVAAARAAPARIAQLGSGVPAPLLMVAAMLSFQLGAAVATGLFARVGIPATAFLRNLGRRPAPARDRAPQPAPPPAELLWLVAFGVELALMNVLFYEAIKRIPLGVAVTVEFVGPLSVALLQSRRLRDVIWASSPPRASPSSPARRPARASTPPGSSSPCWPARPGRVTSSPPSASAARGRAARAWPPACSSRPSCSRPRGSGGSGR